MPPQWSVSVAAAAEQALRPLADSTHATSMAAYMKHVAPFLGVTAVPRREALRAAWSGMAMPSSDQLGEAARTLRELPEREFHYGAYDLIALFRANADERFLSARVTDLLTTKPWWDTVDGLVSFAVSPLCRRFDCSDLIDEWSASGDRWLVRAAIGHQRGWRSKTDVSRVVGLCDRHWHESEFFIAKAIGWALRDLAGIDPAAVQYFLDSRTSPNRVAAREAERGLAAARRLSAGKTR